MTATQGDLLANAAIQQAGENADADWMAAARRVVWHLINTREAFTTDDVWALLEQQQVTAHEPRALGAVIKAAAKAGYIVASDVYVKSTRPDCHSRPIMTWLSVRSAA